MSLSEGAKFFVSQPLRWGRIATARNMAGGAYKIVKQLPERNGEFEYRIKNINEPHERVVREIELLIIRRS